MPAHWKTVAKGVYERPAFAAADYTVSAAWLDEVKAWYGQRSPELEDRLLPDGYHAVVEEVERGGRHVAVLQSKTNEACIEVSWRDDGGTQADVEVRPLPPEEAYERALDDDERWRARGTQVYNERHPRPA